MRHPCLPAVVAALALASTQAPAADFPVEPILPTPSFVQVSSGFYLRGDLGYRWNRVSHVDGGFLSNAAHSDFDEAFSAGFGVGYKAGWFRADITADWSPDAHFTATNDPVLGNYTGKITSGTVLANGYLDLGTWSGFSPYVGGGLGVAYLRTSNFSSAAFPGVVFTGLNTTGLAWAGMAGIAYSLAPNLVADFGYRYLDLGDAIARFGAANELRVKNITAHEIRAGVRWSM